MVNEKEEERKIALKDIKNAMEGKDDDVLLLTDVYHDDKDSQSSIDNYANHQEILGNINETLDFINSDKIRSNTLEATSQNSMSTLPEVKKSLKKLQEVKMGEESKLTVKDELSHSVTLEDLLIKLLKPQLAKWLDEHLSPIVEKEVKKAIETIVSDK